MSYRAKDIATGAGAGLAVGAGASYLYDLWRKQADRELIDGRPIERRSFDPRQLATDPETFQFKAGGDAAGATDRLKGVKRWNQMAAGTAVVFERADGTPVVADGHQRRALGARLADEGQRVRLDSIVLRERDGWTPRDVRAYAAIKNMHESSGSALDMARVMRERPDLVTDSLPVSDAKVRDARHLSRLTPEAFRMVEAGVVKPDHAAAIGEAVKDSSRQVSLMKEMAKADIGSAQHARLYVGQSLAAPSITETTSSLFGDETTTRSLFKERAAVLDKALTGLKQDKRLFGLLEREAGTIEAAGNRLAHETNIAKAEGAGRTAALVEKLATTKGPLSDMLDEAARAVAKGESPAKAARAFTRQVGDRLKSGGINALTTGAAPAVVAAPSVAADAATPKAAAKKGRKPRLQEMVDDGPIKIGGGDRLQSATGRPLSPFPKVDTTSNRTTGNTLKRVDAWLHAEAVKEVAKDSWKSTLVKGINPARMSQADRDTLNLMLFGDPDGAKPAHLLSRAASAPAKAAPPPASGQTSFLPAASTADEIAAKSRALAAKGRVGDPMNTGLFGSSAQQTDLVNHARAAKAAEIARNIDRLERLGYQGFRDAAAALNMDTSGGNSAIRARLEAAAPQDFTGRLQQVADQFESRARKAAEAELAALAAKTGAPADVQAKAVAAGMAEHDRVGKALMKGRPGWDTAPAFDPHAFSVRVALAKQGAAGLAERLNALEPDQIRALAAAQNLSGLPPAGADKATLVNATIEATVRREANFKAAAGNDLKAGIRDGAGNLWKPVPGDESAWQIDRSDGKNPGWSDEARAASAEARANPKGAPTGPMTLAQMKAHAKELGIEPRWPAIGRPGKDLYAEAIADHYAGVRSGERMAGKSFRGPEFEARAARAEQLLNTLMGKSTETNAALNPVTGGNPGAEARGANMESSKSKGAARKSKVRLPSVGQLWDAWSLGNWSDIDRSLERKSPAQLDEIRFAIEERIAKAKRLQAAGEKGMAGNGNYWKASDKQKRGSALQSHYEDLLRRPALERSRLRGTQNPANLAAIVENRQANVVPVSAFKKRKPSSVSMRKAEAAKAFEQTFGKAPPARMSAAKAQLAVSQEVMRRAHSAAKTESAALSRSAWGGQSVTGPEAKARVVAAGQAVLRADRPTTSTRVKAPKPKSSGGGVSSLFGPLAIGGAAALAFDAAKNRAHAAGKSDSEATKEALKEGLIAGGTVGATGTVIAGGLTALARYAPRVALGLGRGLGVVAAASALYEVGKGAVEGYKKGGVGGAVAGGALGGADFLTLGAVSEFAKKAEGMGGFDVSVPGVGKVSISGPPKNLSAEDQQQYAEANAEYDASGESAEHKAKGKAKGGNNHGVSTGEAAHAGLRGWAHPAVQAAAQQARGAVHMTSWATLPMLKR